MASKQLVHVSNMLDAQDIGRNKYLSNYQGPNCYGKPTEGQSISVTARLLGCPWWAV